MKTRTGFVSNSSSSSFVIIGFPMLGPVDWEIWNEIGADYILTDLGPVIGRLILNVGSGDWADNKARELTDILREMEQIRMELGLENLPAKVYSGTRAT